MKEYYTRGAFLAIMIILVSISLLTYRNLEKYTTEVRMVRHSNRVLNSIQDVLLSIKDAEIGHRGYQLTRDSIYLVPYFNSVKELPDKIRTLDSLLSFNERQSRKADTLGLLVNNQFRIISQILSNARRSSLYMDEYESTLLARGKANMDEIRSLVKKITAEEEMTFSGRVSRETEYRNTAPIALLVYTLVALSGMTFLFVRILEALRNRKKVEGQLKENVEELRNEAKKREFAQKSLRNVLDNSLDSIMAFRSLRNASHEIEDFEWIMSNSIGSRLAGRPEQKLIGTRFLEVMPKNIQVGLFDHFKEVIETGRPQQFEKRYEKDGISTWYSITVVRLEDGFVVTFSDITTQKEQQLLIDERGLILKEAETLANMGSWKWYEKTDHIIWSDGLYRIWGYRPQSFEPIWNSFLENVHPQDRSHAADFISQIKTKQSGSEITYRIESGGHIKYVLLVANRRENSEMQSVDILGTVIDITTQKNAEKDMLIAERLSMTGKMARTIAHEVRNPLTSLNLSLEQLKDEIPKGNDTAKVYLDIIERNANRIEQLIGEMLNSSKPRELSLELTSIADVIEDAISLTIDRINLNQIKLEKNTSGNLPRILLDREKIKIALLNIIINAVEAMTPGNGILKLNTELKDGFVIVSICDNGKGISPEDFDKLFDPFYTAKQGGMGLGLTSTKNILNSHSATIEVSSVPNRGTTFYVYFKLAPH